MKTHQLLIGILSLGLAASLALASTPARAESASEMMTKLDDENAAGNITDEATFTDLQATLNNAQSAGNQEDRDAAKDAYNTLVMVNDGHGIKTDAVVRLVWP